MDTADREVTMQWAQRAMTLAIRLHEQQSIRLRDGSVFNLDTPALRESICQRVFGFITALTLEEDRVSASTLLERLKVYIGSEGDGLDDRDDAEVIHYC